MMSRNGVGVGMARLFLSKRQLYFAVIDFIDQHQIASVCRTQLFIRIEQFDTVDGSIRRNINVQFVRKSVSLASAVLQ
jgi:hypothetical protein